MKDQQKKKRSKSQNDFRWKNIVDLFKSSYFPLSDTNGTRSRSWDYEKCFIKIPLISSWEILWLFELRTYNLCEMLTPSYVSMWGSIILFSLTAVNIECEQRLLMNTHQIWLASKFDAVSNFYFHRSVFNINATNWIEYEKRNSKRSHVA